MIKDVLDLMDRYFDLLYTCDVSTFDKVFHPNAALQTVGANGYAIVPAAQYREILAKRASPASSGAPRRDEVITVDLASATSVMVKAKALINGVTYCDYLSLLKVEDGWRIVAKVYSIVSD